jgi:hypothetical protein
LLPACTDPCICCIRCGCQLAASTEPCVLRMSSSPPAMRSATPPVSAVRLQQNQKSTAQHDTAMSGCHESTLTCHWHGSVCFWPNHQQHTALSRQAGCLSDAALPAQDSHAHNICNRVDKDLAVPNLSCVRCCGNSPHDQVHLVPATVAAAAAAKMRHSQLCWVRAVTPTSAAVGREKAGNWVLQGGYRIAAAWSCCTCLHLSCAQDLTPHCCYRWLTVRKQACLPPTPSLTLTLT